jgi:hypothetical protein
MADLSDFTGKNRKFTGSTGITVSTGANTGNRVNEAGRFRFNTSTNLMEYYTGTDWKSVDAPPVVTGFTVDGGASVTSAFIDSSQVGNATIVISGSLFDPTSATVTFEGTGGGNISPITTTNDSANQITVTVAYSSFSNSFEPYNIKVENPSGLGASLAEAITVDTAPVFTNAVDTIFTIFDSVRSSVNISAAQLVGATDTEGDTITYSVSSGALPTGLTLNSATGAITGSTSAVGSNTTTTFTISAATTDQTVTRQFKITQAAPTVTSFTSTGSFTFSVPSGVTAVDALVIAGGGGGGWGGGGAGGMIYRPGFPVSPGSSIPGNIGGGGAGGNGNQPPGQDSVFGSLTAKGGGGGGNHGPGGGGNGNPGGSGGGVGRDGGPSPGGGGSANQPGQAGDSGNYGHGHPGGPNPHGMGGWQAAGGGGGAGGSGSPGSPQHPSDEGPGGPGGPGRAVSITGSPQTYAGGGGGGRHNSGGRGTGAPGPGGGGAGVTHTTAPNGGTNQGGGGGGGHPGGTGGPGVVIVRY